MLSGFQSREFGLGLRSLLTPAVLNVINEKRRGEHYKSSDDAKLLQNTSLKAGINGDPTLQYFEAVVNKDGY